MKQRIAVYTVGWVIGLTAPVCSVLSQETVVSSNAREAPKDSLEESYLKEALLRVQTMLAVFNGKAKVLSKFDTDILKAEKVISKAIVDWNSLQKNVTAETEEIKKSLWQLKSANGQPKLSRREERVQQLSTAIDDLKKEKRFRLSADEVASLSDSEKPLPVRSINKVNNEDDSERLRGLEQQLKLADRITKVVTPGKVEMTRTDSLKFITQEIKPDEKLGEARQAILDALKALQPKESK